MRRYARLPVALAIVATVLSTGVMAYEQTRRFFAFAAPQVPSIDPWRVLFWSPPVTVTVGGHGAAAPWRTTVDELRRSPALWQRMHLADWNAVPSAVRADGLDAMLARYKDMLMQPSTWDRMTTEDWDNVPQPIRTVAYRQMVAYWAGFYRVGADYNLSPRMVAEILAAIVMSESWFDHRAGRVYEDGSRDIGLGQASDFARDRVRDLYRRGVVDATLSDAEYANPWRATRFVALWMSLMLDEARGNLDLAVRAYNRGIDRASDRAGTEYLEMVHQRLSRYIRNREAPDAWDYLSRRARVLERQEWPWTALGKSGPPS